MSERPFKTVLDSRVRSKAEQESRERKMGARTRSTTKHFPSSLTKLNLSAKIRDPKRPPRLLHAKDDIKHTFRQKPSCTDILAKTKRECIQDSNSLRCCSDVFGGGEDRRRPFWQLKTDHPLPTIIKSEWGKGSFNGYNNNNNNSHVYLHKVSRIWGFLGWKVGHFAGWAKWKSCELKFSLKAPMLQSLIISKRAQCCFEVSTFIILK